MNLYILKYNNYYNRTIKKEDSLTDYLQYQLGNVIQGVAFNPGDGIATQQVVNLTEDQIGDYLLAVNEYNEIDSRWFILDCRRERTGQYTLTLRRDLVVDNYNSVISAPCFIEKATLNDSDPMIYNSEDMTFNQIKTSETPLKDETGCAWVVGYIPSNSFQEDTTINGNIILEHSADITIDNLKNWDLYPYLTGTQFKAAADKLFYAGYVSVSEESLLVKKYRVIGWGCDKDGDIYNPGGTDSSIPGLTTPDYGTTGYGLQYWAGREWKKYDPILQQDYGIISINKGVRTGIGSRWAQNISTLNTQSQAYTQCATIEQTKEFEEIDNKVIYETDSGLYYRIKIKKDPITDVINITAGNLFNSLNNFTNDTTFRDEEGRTKDQVRIHGTPNSNNFKLQYTYKSYSLYLEQILVNATVTLNNTRYHLEDQPYDMFCIPYSDTLKIYKNGEEILTSNKSLSVNMAIEIANDTGAGNIYDVQLLPYCPVRYCIKSDGTFDIGNAFVHYVKDSSTNENIGIILWATTSSGTLNINQSINIDRSKLKQISQTDKWRLVSPNYNGQFEFNVALNNGVDYFNVDYNYKPFSPYIHVNPNFKNLYGQDFNDARGLICGGDFSLPQITNAWADYQLSNKNYQQMFDRQIENMEVNNAVQREQQKWQIASGAIGAGISGTLTGAVAGGPIGAVIGGIIGAGASTAAGIRDYQLSEQLRQEAIDYKIDQFGYSLGNIQAMPNSLAKTSAFTYNNKIFPILEYYTCTEEEKTALQNKLYYNGMTVMRIGTIQEFLRSEPSYIKGKLIRFEGTDNNFHVVNEIANEINKGVFI